jgi:WD40 repeat protein
MHIDTGGKMLRKICCHANRLFCCLENKVLIMTLEGAQLGVISVAAANNSRELPPQMSCLLIGPRDELWVGFSSHGQVCVYNTETTKLKAIMSVACPGISTLTPVSGQVWAGSKQGVIYAFNAMTYQCERELKAHTSCISAVGFEHGRFVFTVADGVDGKIAVWKWPTA